MDAGQEEGRNAVLERFDCYVAVALLLGEEARAVGHDQAEVANAGLVDAGIIDLIEDAVADGEPDAACVRQSRPDAALGARRPAGRNSWPAWRFGHGFPSGRTPAAEAIRRRIVGRPGIRSTNGAQAAISPDKRIGRAVVSEGGLGPGRQLRLDALGEDLAELDAPLVERVDVPDG